MINGERVSLVIPAHNESERISGVLEAAVDSYLLDDIIVVDDGSTDATHKIAENYGITVLQHTQNQGKGEAMQTGYHHAKEMGATVLLFLDADLFNLNSNHIESLVYPIVSWDATMTIGILERTHLQKAILKHWGGLSGQRALPVEFWEELPAEYKRGSRVEAALNASARHGGWHRDIQRVELHGVTHAGKRDKEPTLTRAALAYAKTYGTALMTYAKMEQTNLNPENFQNLDLTAE